MSILDRLKGVFRRDKSREDLALTACFIPGDQTLMTEFLMFYRSHTTAGTTLFVTERDLAFLDEVLSGAGEVFSEGQDMESVYNGVAVYFGTLVVLNMGGRWGRTADGHYIVGGLGTSGTAVDPFAVVGSVVGSGGGMTLGSEYARLRSQCSE